MEQLKPPLSNTPIPSEETVRIRKMTIDDFPEVFHIGEEVFTAEQSQSLYRTWDEYEITTLFNSDNELCLVAEAGVKILGFALGTTVKKHNSPWKYGYLVWLGVCRDIQQGGGRQRVVQGDQAPHEGTGGADNHDRYVRRQSGGNSLL